MNGDIRGILQIRNDFFNAHVRETITFNAKWDPWVGKDAAPIQAGAPVYINNMLKEYPRTLVLELQLKYFPMYRRNGSPPRRRQGYV